MNLPGRHNVLNALAAIAVATELKVSDKQFNERLKILRVLVVVFRCMGFSFEKGGRVTLVDDYGHHPSEMAVTIQAARYSWPNRRFIMVYQPHRYTGHEIYLMIFVGIIST